MIKWISGFIILVVLIIVICHFSQLRVFLGLIEQMKFSWLFFAVIFQSGTYMSLAAVWRLAFGLKMVWRTNFFFPALFIKFFSTFRKSNDSDKRFKWRYNNDQIFIGAFDYTQSYCIGNCFERFFATSCLSDILYCLNSRILVLQ
ncbi:Uncharacterised protein [Legionella pneumophila]|nr:Uncharacterised protein [Legionella pneumophila]